MVGYPSSTFDAGKGFGERRVETETDADEPVTKPFEPFRDVVGEEDSAEQGRRFFVLGVKGRDDINFIVGYGRFSFGAGAAGGSCTAKGVKVGFGADVCVETGGEEV